ncbi:hypothetical protein SASPL_126611 [Salvia splendens]|uniref:Plastocyanin-like domain-containing protein n=1 Tax=Salvia splendens TaxID=180675 RepID=A0A8X8XM62_SALSN|nr:hypothetical protein SASPL_126611 [Salvia splendens]
MTARPYVTGPGTFDNSTVAGILEYETPSLHIKNLPLLKPQLPPLNDTSFATTFAGRLRSLASAEFPAKVSQEVERRFFFTVGLGTSPCDRNALCQGPNETKFAASVSNVSFVLPLKALLGVHFAGQSSGVYSPNFPVSPLRWFNYMGSPPSNTAVGNGTKLVILAFNTSVEVGFGNYDPNSDPNRFNLVDPVERNAVGVPAGRWVAIRMIMNGCIVDSGVWFMHCHLEVHTSWGLKMAWLVLDGKLPNQKLLPPPSDLPKC